MSESLPHVVFVGGGAMGSMFGALLSHGGLPVTLVDPWQEHIRKIGSDGLRLVADGGHGTVTHPAAVTDPAGIARADIVVFLCKGHATVAAATAVRRLFEAGAVAISFQNGLGNEEAIAGVVGAENVLGGTTAQAAAMDGPGIVRTFGSQPSLIGELGGGASERAQRIAATFSAHGLPTTASADIRKDKWKKLLANVGLAGVSGITGLRSMEMVSVPELRATIFRLVHEAAAVARAIGVDLAPSEAEEVVRRLITPANGGTGGSRSSLYADLAAGRRTEIDQIYGSVARHGREHDVPTPTIDAVIGLVKGLEAR